MLLLLRSLGPEVAEQLSVYQHSLKEKTRKMKAMAAELNMFQAQANEFRYEVEKVSRDNQDIKRKFFEQRKQEQLARSFQKAKVHTYRRGWVVLRGCLSGERAAWCGCVVGCGALSLRLSQPLSRVFPPAAEPFQRPAVPATNRVLLAAAAHRGRRLRPQFHRAGCDLVTALVLVSFAPGFCGLFVCVFMSFFRAA